MVLKLSTVALNLLNVLKSRLCFQEKWQTSRVNNSKTIKIKNVQLQGTVEHVRSTISKSVLVCLCVPKFFLKRWEKCLPIKTLILFKQTAKQSSI